MIKYSKPRIIILIVILLLLWAGVRCNAHLPFSRSEEVRMVMDKGRVTVYSGADGSTHISPSQDDSFHLITASGEHQSASSGTITVRDPGDVTIGVPAGLASISFNGIGDVLVEDVEAGSIAVSSVSADLMAEGVRAGELRLTTIDGDITVTSPGVPDLRADTVNGDIRLTLETDGTIRAETVNGDIIIDVPDPQSYSQFRDGEMTGADGSAIMADTVNGSVTLI